MQFLDLDGLRQLWAKVLASRTEVYGDTAYEQGATMSDPKIISTLTDGLSKHYTLSLQNVASASALSALQDTVDSLVTTGGEPNVIESVQVNGSALTVTNKAVNVTVAEGATNGTIAVNGTDVPVHGLGSAAYTPATDYATATQGGYADSALQSITNGTDGDFVTTSIGAKAGENGAKSQTIAVSVTTKTVSGATAGDDGLAKASDVKSYVDSAVAGLSGAMHYIGTTTTEVTDGGSEQPTIGGSPVTELTAGDVVLYGNQEFIWNGSAWELFGDEGSYALKTISISAGTGLTGGGNLTENRTISLSTESQTSLGRADSALQSVSHGTDGDYVTVTVGSKTGSAGSYDQAISAAVTVQAVSTANSSNKGLAEASDVKSYVDGQLANGNITIASNTETASGTAAHSGTFVVNSVTTQNGSVTAVGSVEVEAAGAAAAVLGTSSDTASDMTVYGVKAYVDSALGSGGNVATQITNAIGDLDASDTAVAGKYVSAVSEENGVITVSRSDLPGVTFNHGAATTPATNTVDVVSAIGNVAGAGNTTSAVSVVSVATAAGVSAAVADLDSAINVAGSTGNIAATNTSNPGTTTTHVTSTNVLTGVVITDGKISSGTSVTVEAISDEDLAALLVYTAA